MKKILLDALLSVYRIDQDIRKSFRRALLGSPTHFGTLTRLIPLISKRKWRYEKIKPYLDRIGAKNG